MGYPACNWVVSCLRIAVSAAAGALGVLLEGAGRAPPCWTRQDPALEGMEGFMLIDMFHTLITNRNIKIPHFPAWDTRAINDDFKGPSSIS